ncbi:hypothetical protein ASD97_26070 [Streptomyces sp. Root63]|uniref:hypothetical protein n=1 Tax=unclassified Streptomyces TaxID=2593676 RepID=UPI0006F402A3|nr:MULTISPECIES: hypothetical protein [unclassified Streptomyces]KQX43538.1 hypothetical protein ASD29_32375 [Streptomyces sp. Root1295]KRA34101.1 hypothetical protein ASD97_26070 [Streptomyces sp. Root63]
MATARKTAASKTSLAAKQAEAVHEEKTEDTETKYNEFDFKGGTYKVPADPLDVPMSVAFADSEFEIVQEIVGPEQWAEFCKTKPTIRHFGEFSELVLKASGQGEDEGN